MIESNNVRTIGKYEKYGMEYTIRQYGERYAVLRLLPFDEYWNYYSIQLDEIEADSDGYRLRLFSCDTVEAALSYLEKKIGIQAL